MGERFSRGKKIKKLVEKEKEERNKIGEESKFVGRRVFSLEKKEKKKKEEESLCVRRAFFFFFHFFSFHGKVHGRCPVGIAQAEP